MAEGIFIGNAIIDGGKNYSIQTDVIANLPPAGTANRWFLSTDTNTLYWDNGTTWLPILNSPAGGSLTGADNGLDVSGTTVELGGTLVKATDIATSGNLFGVNSGLTTGTSTLLIDAQSVLARINTFGNLYTIANVLPLIWKLSMRNGAPAQFDAAIISDTQTTFGDQTGVYLLTSRAALTIAALANAVATKFLQADASGHITNVTLPMSDADNGLTITGGVVELGGTALKQTTLIDTGGQIFFAGTFGGGVAGGSVTLKPSGSSLGFLNASIVPTDIQIGDDDIVFISAGSGVAEFTSAMIKFNNLANAVATRFLKADSSGNITNVDVAAALIAAGSFINNQTSLQTPGNFNITGGGQTNSTQTNVISPKQGLVSVLSYIFNAAISPTSGVNFGSVGSSLTMQFDASNSFANTLLFGAYFSQVFLQSTVSSTTNIANGTSGGLRALSAFLAQFQLPVAAPGVVSTINNVAGLAVQSIFMTGGTTNSVQITNYYGLLLSPSDEQLTYAAVTNKYGIWQDGANDKNFLRGAVQLAALANTDATKFVQADNFGNLTNVKAFTNGAEAAYTGTIVWIATTAPTVVSNNTYSYTIVGNMVNVSMHLLYTVQGTAVTRVKCTLPAGMPTPKIPAGWATNNTPLYDGRIAAFAGLGSSTLTGTGGSFIAFDGTNFIFDGSVNSGNYLAVIFQFTYFTS